MKAEVRKVPLSEVEPDPENKNFHPEESIQVMARNLERYGQIHPIVVREEEGKFRIIDGELRWRAAKRLGWEEIEAKVVKERLTRSFVRGQRTSANKVREFDWVAESEEFRQLVESGLTQAEIGRLFGVSYQLVSHRILAADILEILDPSLKAEVRKGEYYRHLRDVSEVIGVRRENGKRVFSDQERQLINNVIQGMLQNQWTSEETRAEALRLKTELLEKEVEKVKEEISQETDRLVAQKLRAIEEEFERKKAQALREEVAKVEESFIKKLSDAQTQISALEAKLSQKDELSAREIKTLREELKRAREEKEKLQGSLDQEKARIREELSQDFQLRLEQALKRERERLEREARESLTKREEELKKLQQRLSDERERLLKEARDLEAKRKIIEDRAVTAKQVLASLIRKITDLNLSLAGIDNRYLSLLETEEKLQLARAIFTALAEMERVINLIKEEKDIREEALKAIYLPERRKND